MKTISTGKAFNELDSKELGKWGERVATNYIEKMGLTVVDTNYRTRLGEIDIIAKRDLVYHFIKRRWKEISFDVIEVYLHEDFQSSIHYLPQCF